MVAGTGERTPARAQDAGRSRAHLEARRHSGRVRFLKVVIPIGSAIGVAAVAYVTFFDPFGRFKGVTLGPVSLSGTKITMESPRMTGYRKDSRGYEVTATAAFQDVRKPTVVELKEMKARLALDDAGKMARLTSASGVFDTQKEQLELVRDIHVVTDDGQEAFLKSALVDFKAGTVASKEAVTIRFTGGTIDADALDIGDSGKVITFTGRVRAVFESAGSSTLRQAAKPEPDPAAAEAEPRSRLASDVPLKRP